MVSPRDRILTVTAALAAILLLISLASRSAQPESWSYPYIQSSRLQQPSAQHQTQLSAADPHLQDRLNRAERLWAQSVKDRKHMLTVYNQPPSFPDGYILPYHIWDFARPSFFCPHDLERVGTLGDGGKWVCGMSRYEKVSPGPSSKDNEARPLVVYSFGVNDDSSFEAALLERTNAEIWGYDYTVNGWANHIPSTRLSRAHFKKAGIGETNPNHDPPFYSIQDLMANNGHDFIDIMKMDIEGAEFTALSLLVESAVRKGNATLPIGQLLVEIHFMPDTASTSPMPKTLEKFMEWWDTLERLGMRPVNNEDNWIGDAGYCRPRFMEYTMINGVDTQRNVLLWT